MKLLLLLACILILFIACVFCIARAKHTTTATFSQYGQDEVCSQILSEKFGVYKTGFYCDVGAHDGVSLSNTLLFAKRGWRGVCIEAHPGPFAKLVENRPQAINVQCAAFDGSKDVVTFQANSGGTEMLSGIVANYDPRHVQRITNEGGRGNMIEVQAKTLDTILSEAGTPLIIDFLSIDVEGGELAVVKGLNKYKAKVIAIENNYPDDTSVRDLIVSKGYALERKVGCDDIYVLVQ